MQIKYYLNFKEDQRIGMDIYANQTIKYLKKNYQLIHLNALNTILIYLRIKIVYPNY